MSSPIAPRPYNLNDALLGTGKFLGGVVARGARDVGRGMLMTAHDAGLGDLLPAPSQYPEGYEDPAAVPQGQPAPPAAPVTAGVKVGSPAWRQRYPQAALKVDTAAPKYDAPVGDPTPTDADFEFENRIPGDEAARAGVMSRARVDTPDPWNPSGGPRSLAQMESDTRGHAILDAAYEPEFARIQTEDARVNPMNMALEARKKTLAYEAMMPATDGYRQAPDGRLEAVPYMPKLRMGDASHGMRDEYQAAAVSPSRAQALEFQKQLELANAKNMDPKAMLSLRDAASRSAEMENISAEHARMLGEVQKGRMKPEDVTNRMRTLVIDAAQRGALNEGDYASLAKMLYPSADALMAGEAATGTMHTPGRP
jgi:hypothetical protein